MEKCNLNWWNNAPVIRHKWAVLRAWWPISFIAYFETVLGREHLQEAVSVESLDKVYFWEITLKALFRNSKFNQPELKFGRNDK